MVKSKPKLAQVHLVNAQRTAKALARRVQLAARAPLTPMRAETHASPRLVSRALAAAANDYVTVISPTSTPGDSTSAPAGPKKLFVPPRAPVAPPSGPDSPGSGFGSVFGGGAGGALLVVAALTGLLALVLPHLTTRTKELVETPFAYRHALSLECPG